MEILKTLLSFIMQNFDGGKYGSILKLLEENSFDLAKTLSNLSPDDIEPIIKDVFKETPSPQEYRTEPIKKIADEEIVATLNRYFSKV